MSFHVSSFSFLFYSNVQLPYSFLPFFSSDFDTKKTAQNGRLSSIDVVSFTEIQSNFALPRGGVFVEALRALP